MGTTIRFAYELSKDAIQSGLIATGKKPDSIQHVVFDFENMTMDQRAIFAPEVDKMHGYSSIGRYTFDLDKQPSYLASETAHFAAEPTIDQVAEILIANRAARAQADAHKAEIEAREKAKYALDLAQYEVKLAELEAAAKLGLDALEAVSFSDCDLTFKPLYGGHRSLIDTRNEMRKELTSAMRAEQQREWIATHGSERLRKAYAGNYNVARLYATERALAEWPDYEIDFSDHAEWKDRVSPSLKALNEEELTDKRIDSDPQNKGMRAAIVWLTKPISDGSEYDEYDFEECEAVVVRGFLDKYDLIKIVRTE